ncbi:carotenoid biosynthesis protein [Actinomadura graeca]|uniref:Carotenoid biosynthesis protein n=1 Tax=Actinomadura graeca TaxID=2750812 RepID=A0ABX8QUD7_9ACTN|nr:carotenoid biosynthesis protein [Actinomadura graeca]QXJ22248.1 carotenoid biosynthesis protein [Actinomadura graeca]
MGQVRDEPARRRGTAARRRPGVWAPVGSAFLVAMVAAQVASGLRPGSIRLTGVVVVLLAACAVAFLAGAHGPKPALGAFGGTVLVGYAAEWIGVRTGVPFGDYSYTPLLRPQPGGVPVVVALAWGGMGLAAHAVASAIVPAGGLARWAAGAAALTAWDLFLDPQMLRLGLWTWADGGPYRGVPLTNFAGWLAVSLLVMAVVDAWTGTGTRPGAAAASRGLVVLYTVMAAMETLAFAAVFEPPDRTVAVAGGIAMAAFALPAWSAVWRRRWPR